MSTTFSISSMRYSAQAEIVATEGLGFGVGAALDPRRSPGHALGFGLRNHGVMRHEIPLTGDRERHPDIPVEILAINVPATPQLHLAQHSIGLAIKDEMDASIINGRKALKPSSSVRLITVLRLITSRTWLRYRLMQPILPDLISRHSRFP
jgi:hypothetical protein